MDRYGNPINGDKFTNPYNEDLTIDGDLKVDGDLNVTGTITAVDELEVKDTLITVGVDNPDDLLNLGMLEQYTSGGIKWSGLVRSHTDKKHYILKDTIPKPTPGDDITALTRGDLVLNTLESTSLTSLVGIINNITTSDVTFERPDDTTAEGITFLTDGVPGDNWFLGQTQSSSEFVLKNNLGQLIMKAEQGGGITAYTPDGVTSDSEGRIRLYGTFNYINRWSNNIGGVGIVTFKARGTESAPLALNSGDELQFNQMSGYDGTSDKAGALMRSKATEAWSVGNNGTEMAFSTTDNGASALTTKLILDTDGVTIGDGVSGYILPSNQGTAGQVLATNGAGVAEWSGNIGANAIEFKRPDNTTAKGIQWLTTDDATDGWYLGQIIGDKKLEFKNILDQPIMHVLKTGGAIVYNPNGVGTDLSGYAGIYGDFNYLNRYVSSASGVELRMAKYRGTDIAPLAVLNGDILTTTRSQGYDGLGLGTGADVEVTATENWDSNNQGSDYAVYTTNIGTNIATQKILLNSSGVNINEGANQYSLPTDRGLDGQSIITDGLGGSSWQTSVNYSLQFGGNVNANNDYFVPSGDPNLAVNTTLNNQKEAIIPADSRLVGVTYSTQLGDATTVLDILLNGVSIGTGLLSGAQGVYVLPVPVAALQGDRLAIRKTTGTNPNQSNIVVYSTN